MAKESFFRLNYPFALLQGLFWSSMCLINSFMPLYLESNRYEMHEIGWIFAISSVSMMVGQYLWGTYCYKFSWLSHRNIIIFCMATGIIAMLIFPLFSSNILLICILYSIFCFTAYSMAPMIDAWTMFRKLDTPRIDYGITRGIGSASYAVVAVLFGLIFSYFGMSQMFLYASLFMIGVMFVSSRISSGKSSESALVMEIAGIQSSKSLLKNTRYMIFLISSFLIFTAMIANSTFYGLLITQLGGSSRELGQGLFLLAMTEVPVMFMATWLLRKYSASHLLIFSFIFFLLKTLLLANATHVSIAILANLAQSFSNGLFMPVCLVYLSQIVTKAEATVSYMIISAVTYGLGGIIGNSLGGLVSQQYGLSVMYDSTAILTAIGLLLFIGSMFFKNQPKNTQSSM